MLTGNNANMQRYARILVLICILLCLTLNYTFPLHRDSSKISQYGKYANHNLYCADHGNHKVNIKQRIRKSSQNLRSHRMTKDVSQENKQNPMGIVNNSDKNTINNVDLRQYEQLVIMKKYPYLDFKELEMKYRPSGKNVRHSLPFDSVLDIDNEPSICEQGEELLNVEISNRGLSGFAIPSQTKPIESNLNLKMKAMAQPKNVIQVKESGQSTLESLKQDIFSYLDAKNV
ncbi:uncharacterized protein [Epargyreus clarus]|uniref:uncharacterized protein n=1 Tax=Epargyreus clarus TaxID=520877 RepID=UPI003C2B3F0F